LHMMRFVVRLITANFRHFRSYWLFLVSMS
jgi:hypothetical protein